jgi:hypothetical protein
MSSQPQTIPQRRLADEAATRRAYQFYLLQPSAPRISFEQYALAYGEKKESDDVEIRAAYDRYLADLARNFPGIEGEYQGKPTFDEFKAIYREIENA